MDTGRGRKVLVRGRERGGRWRRLTAVVTAAALIGGLVGVAGVAAPATSAATMTSSTEPNVTTQVDRAREETADAEVSVNHLGMSCSMNSEFELALAYTRDALNQGNILGARGFLQAFMSEARALVPSGLLSASQAAGFESDSRHLLSEIPSSGTVNDEFHPTSQVPAPVPHPCPSTPSGAASTQPSNTVGAAAAASTASSVSLPIEDLNNSARIMLKFAASQVPGAGFALAPLVELLWPGAANNNVQWDDMREYVDKQIGAAIDQQLKDHLDAVLTGLRGVLHNYDIALQSKDATLIKDNFVTTLDQLTKAAPEFAPPTRPNLVLPEYTQIYTFLLQVLRDGVVRGASFGLPQLVIDDLDQQFKSDKVAADEHLKTQYGADHAQVPQPPPGDKHYNVKLFNANQNLDLALVPTTFDQSYYWFYMDPDRFPRPVTPYPDVRTLWSQAYGYMDPANGTPSVSGDPKDELTHLTAWGGDRLDAIQLTYGSDLGPRMGAPGGSDGENSSGEKLGGSFALGNSPDSRGQITTVYGTYGDAQQAVGFKFTKNGTTTDSGQLTLNEPHDITPNSYSLSLPGEELGNVQIMGAFPQPFNSAGSTIWGFRYADSFGQGPVSPSSGDSASMAYDPATQQLLLFGGHNGRDLNDTWVWNGVWRRLAPATAPPARYLASMAYDPASKELVLFGGLTNRGSELDDTWAWDGETWKKLAPAAAPPARYGASMAYDPATNQLVLFGGGGTPSGGSSTLDDTWAWDGATWKKLAPATAPTSRLEASMVDDPATNQLLLFGGWTEGLGSLDDTWAWNGATWSKLNPATRPSPARYRASMAYDPATKQVMLFGGLATIGGELNDTWTWDGATWKKLAPAAVPSTRDGAAIAYDDADNQLVLFGGRDGVNYFDDTWEWTGVTWEIFNPPRLANYPVL